MGFPERGPCPATTEINPEEEFLSRLSPELRALLLPHQETIDSLPEKTTVEMYLADIRWHPILTGDQFSELYSHFIKGRAALDSLSNGTPNGEERASLEQIVIFGKQARKWIIFCNLKLVFPIAERYRSDVVSFLDRIQEGNLGLIKALEKYDPAKGRFTTYATWWIRYEISRSVLRFGEATCRSLSAGSQQRIIYWAIDGLEQELGRRPSVAEIEAMTGIPSGRIKFVLQGAREPARMDAPLKDNDGGGVIFLDETIADQSVPSPEAVSIQHLTAEVLEGLFSCLTPRERHALVLYFGLAGFNPHNLDEIAKKWGMVGESIRGIIFAALTKLRHPYRLGEVG